MDNVKGQKVHETVIASQTMNTTETYHLIFKRKGRCYPRAMQGRCPYKAEVLRC